MFFGTFEENKQIILNQFSTSGRSSNNAEAMNRWSFREACEVEWNQKSGQSIDELKKACAEIEKSMEGKNRASIKTAMFVHIMENAQIAVEPWNIFASSINHGGILMQYYDRWLTELKDNEMKAQLDKSRDFESDDVLMYTSNVDFNHVLPDHERMFRIGFVGIVEELKKSRDAWREKGMTAEQEEYFDCGIRAWEAVLVYMNRLAEECDRRAGESDKLPVVASVLRAMTQRAPETTLEAMQLSYMYYRLETQIEGVNVRSIGGLDRLFWPFWKADLESGRYTEEQLEELWRYFICAYSAFGVTANLPFYLGGQYSDGTSAVNELSYRIVKIYNQLNVYDPKIHIRVMDETPRDFIELVCDTMRDGKTSFAFINDNVEIEAMKKQGIPLEEARNFAIVGCYEPLVYGKEVPCTCNGLVNMPKVLEVVMHNGKDPGTGKQLMSVRADDCQDFESFYQLLLEAIKACQNQIIENVVAYEQYYMRLCPAPLYSGTMPDSVEKGVDVYRGGAKYNNSSFNCIGIATMVDALLAIKKLVYEDKVVTMPQLCKILDDNWGGAEQLHTVCLNKCKKYGNGEKEADALTTRFAHDICFNINGRPNGRGGYFRAGLLSINWGFQYGATVGATPDGRYAYQPLSKNYCATNCMDKNGITGLFRSVTSIDSTEVPNGSVLDAMLHPSAVRGEEGLKAFVDMILAYFKMGGFAIHGNIFDANTLKAAQKEPEKYSTLQVRVCGWNAYFVDLSLAEQNFFIEQAETLV